MSLLPEFFPASLDSLVFEGRNQAYGAYQLRQLYNSHMRKALATMLGLCALAVLAGAEWQHFHPIISAAVAFKSFPVMPIEPPTYVAEKPKSIAPPAAPSQPHPATAAPRATASFPTKIVKDELAPPKSVETITMEVPPGLTTTGPTTAESTGFGVPGGTATAATGAETGTESATAVTGPYLVVEKMPEFAGGTEALMRYLRSHLRYPSQALREQAEGRVYVSFVVQADGTIADISVPKGLGYGLDEEAQRVVRQMPAWTPGQQSHHAVPVRFTLPITFKIQ